MQAPLSVGLPSAVKTHRHQHTRLISPHHPPRCTINHTATTTPRGKHLPTYTPSMDMGAYVVVINADKV